MWRVGDESVGGTYLARAVLGVTRRAAARAAAPKPVGAVKLIEAWLGMTFFTERRNVRCPDGRVVVCAV